MASDSLNNCFFFLLEKHFVFQFNCCRFLTSLSLNRECNPITQAQHHQSPYGPVKYNTSNKVTKESATQIIFWLFTHNASGIKRELAGLL